MKFERFKEILKKEYYDNLVEYMKGQTISNNGIYEDDFLRWFHKMEVVD